MTVVFDARSAGTTRISGWERYTRQLAAQLGDVDGVQVRHRRIDPLPRRFLSDVTTAISARRTDAAFHYPTFPPLTLSKPFVLTIHDLTYWKFPETASFMGRHLYRDLTSRAISRASLIVTHTQSVANEVIETFDVSPGIVVPVSCGVDSLSPHDVCRVDNRRPFILAVGTVEPRKNLVRLVHAFNRSSLKDDVDLVIVGRLGWGDVPTGVTIRSNVTDDELRGLYAACLGLIMPSLYEGFGLPLLEAANFGKPVTCSDLPVFREITDGRALYFDPLDLDAIEVALEGLRDQNVEPLDRSLLEGFTWRAVANNLADAYSQAGLR